MVCAVQGRWRLMDVVSVGVLRRLHLEKTGVESNGDSQVIALGSTADDCLITTLKTPPMYFCSITEEVAELLPRQHSIWIRQLSQSRGSRYRQGALSTPWTGVASDFR